MTQRSRRGFTIVELLIVIVIIAILAAITIVAYNGIQQRAQDARLRASVQQFVKAFQSWSVKSGKTTTVGGAGASAISENGTCTDGYGGWLSKDAYAGCTVESVLINSGDLSPSLLRDLPGTNKSTNATKTYTTVTMLYKCGNQYVALYALNTPDTNEITKIRQLCTGSPTGFYAPFNTWGMTGGIIFDLSS